MGIKPRRLPLKESVPPPAPHFEGGPEGEQPSRLAARATASIRRPSWALANGISGCLTAAPSNGTGSVRLPPELARTPLRPTSFMAVALTGPLLQNKTVRCGAFEGGQKVDKDAYRMMHPTAMHTTAMRPSPTMTMMMTMVKVSCCFDPLLGWIATDVPNMADQAESRHRCCSTTTEFASGVPTNMVLWCAENEW